MKTEMVRTFDDQHRQTGTASREEVHTLGLWHEAFHCWLINEVEATIYIYLQIRSEDKQDFPGLFDITAAGHLTADETAEDGVREMEEELGLSLAYDDLVKLGVFVYQCDRPGFTDREFAHVHLYDKPFSLHDFMIPNDEVCGIARVKFQDFYELWLDIVSEINIEGFQFDANGMRLSINRLAAKSAFAPHDPSFYIAVLQQLEKYLKTKFNK
jgi:isopentenyldiphosphate isomerase